MLTKLFPRKRAEKKKTLEKLRACEWKSIEVPQDVRAVSTMLTYPELQLLHWLSRFHPDGRGRIVDGGCFLGGSTAALASGLAARTDGPWNKTIVSYDLFRVEPYTLIDHAKAFTDPTVGASFRADFDANIAKWSRHVEVREGDAIVHGWSGEPIEILFLDFIKTWRLNDLVMEQFMPCLIPGHSVIVQQDYLWGFGPWVHITMEMFAPYVTIIDAMPYNSVAYLLTAPIPKSMIGIKVRELLSPKAQLELMDQAVNRWQGAQRGMVELARVMLLMETFPKPAVEAELKKTLDRYPRENVVQSCGQRVAEYICDKPWWLT